MADQVIVIGAGAAGIFAAWNAAQNGAEVLLLEKTERIGTKILISGGGKCNITHDGETEDVLRAFRPNEARFIRPACYRLKNTQIVDMLTSRGLRVYTRPDGRIFPVDQTAKDVVAILADYLVRAGVQIRLSSQVTGIEHDGGWIVRLPHESLSAGAVILTTGGSSYPKSGTTGDGWPWARSLGHTIVPIRAALAPIETRDASQFSPGVSLRDVVLKARLAGKEIARWRGDLLFTHHGVSGPCALGISREIAESQDKGLVELEVDLFPDEVFEETQSKIHRWAQLNPSKPVKSMPLEKISSSLLGFFFSCASLDAESRLQTVNKKQLNRLAMTAKGWVIGAVKTVPLVKGEVVAGGVDLNEIDPKSMESKLRSGLFLAGEVLDIAGPVGGYNLQAAFATGYLAGESAAKKVLVL